MSPTSPVSSTFYDVVSVLEEKAPREEAVKGLAPTFLTTSPSTDPFDAPLPSPAFDVTPRGRSPSPSPSDGAGPSQRTVDFTDRRRSFFPPPSFTADLAASTDRSRPAPQARFDSEAAEMALAKLEGRAVAAADLSTSTGSAKSARSHISAEEDEPAVKRYQPRPLLLPAYSNRDSVGPSGPRPNMKSRRTLSNSTSGTAPESSAGAPVQQDTGRSSLASSRGRSSAFHASTSQVHFSDSSPSKRRYSAPRFSPSKASPYSIYQARRMSQQIQEDARRAERSATKWRQEAQSSQEGEEGAEELGSDEDAWTLIDSEEGQPSPLEAEDDVFARKARNRRSVIGEALADMDGDPAVIWRASLDVGRRTGRTYRRPYNCGRRPYALAAPPALSRLDSVEEDESGTVLTAALERRFPSGHATITGSSAPSTRALSKASTFSTHSIASSASASRTLAANAGYQGLLRRIYAAWQSWSPRQKARALFSYGVLGGMIGGLILAAIKAQVRPDRFLLLHGLLI